MDNFSGEGGGPSSHQAPVDLYINIIIKFSFLLVFRFREDRIKSVQYFEYTIPNYLPDAFKHFFKVSH